MMRFQLVCYSRMCHDSFHSCVCHDSFHSCVCHDSFHSCVCHLNPCFPNWRVSTLMMRFQLVYYSHVCHDSFMCVPWLIHVCAMTHSCVCHLNPWFPNWRGSGYGVATIGMLNKIIGLFCRIASLLYGSFAKETCNFKEPTNYSHPILGRRDACAYDVRICDMWCVHMWYVMCAWWISGLVD